MAESLDDKHHAGESSTNYNSTVIPKKDYLTVSEQEAGSEFPRSIHQSTARRRKSFQSMKSKSKDRGSQETFTSFDQKLSLQNDHPVSTSTQGTATHNSGLKNALSDNFRKFHLVAVSLTTPDILENTLSRRNEKNETKISPPSPQQELFPISDSNSINETGTMLKNLKRYFVLFPAEGNVIERVTSDVESSKLEKESKAHRPSTISNNNDPGKHSSDDTQTITMNRQESETEPVQNKSSMWKGIILACCASVLFSAAFVIVKYLQQIHPGQLALFRFIGMFIFVIPMVMNSGIRSIWNSRKAYHWLLLQGCLGGFSNTLLYTSLQYLPMANAVVIALTEPIFVCIFARIFLKEACGLFHVIALAITIIGVLVTTKLAFLETTDDSDSTSKRTELWGLLCGLGSSMIFAIEFVITRHLKFVSLACIYFFYGLVGSIECLILTAVLGKLQLPMSGLAPWLLCALTTVGFYSSCVLALALQAEEAGLVSVVVFSANMLFAFLTQVTIFQDILDAYSSGGASLVLFGVILISLRKWASNLPETSQARKLLWLLLK